MPFPSQAWRRRPRSRPPAEGSRATSTRRRASSTAAQPRRYDVALARAQAGQRRLLPRAASVVRAIDERTAAGTEGGCPSHAGRREAVAVLVAAERKLPGTRDREAGARDEPPGAAAVAARPQ